MRRVWKTVAACLALIALLLAGPFAVWWSGDIGRGHWSNATRDSAGTAPTPEAHREAVVQIYGARAFSWRGAFAMHTWIALKAPDASYYVTHEVQGWRQPAVRSRSGTPDRAWFGQPAVLLGELRGERAAAAIADIEKAVRNYPRTHHYRAWPGPNSNTFTAWVIRRVPALEVALPALALGKDYLIDDERPAGRWFASAPSATGYQVSLAGALGVMLARDEGLEFNLLGLVFGVDPLDGAIKLPGIGRIGLGALYRSPEA